jgi:protein involved in polysaccharide export with SLBB domain
MTRRTFLTGTLLPLYLGAICVGFCTGPDDQRVFVPTSANGDEHATNRLGDTNGFHFDSARILSPNDVILVTVYQEDDLTTKIIIDKNGMVMLPLLGQVKIGGLSIGQATERIQQLYDKDYLVNPRVNLIAEHFAERRFSVLGQVQHPGNFDFPQNEPVNLLEALAIAGGYTRLGAPSKVDLRRIENGASRVYHFDADQMAKDSRLTPFEILPNDIITVGERTF